MFSVYPKRVMVLELNNEIKDGTSSHTSSGASPLLQHLTAGNISPMDELVHAIRENLKLKAPVVSMGCCHLCGGQISSSGVGSSRRSSRRMSPYSIPCRENRHPETLQYNQTRCSLCGTTSSNGTSKSRSQPHTRSAKLHSPIRGSKKATGHEDPYELLQVLLKQGTLISEAVRRLQQDSNKKDAIKASRFLRSPSGSSSSIDSAISCDSSAPSGQSTTTIPSSNVCKFVPAVRACAAAT